MNDAGPAPKDAWRVRLTGASRLASGGEKEIYERPGKPSQIVKVYRADHIARIAGSRKLKIMLRRRGLTGPHKNLIRQYGAFLDAMLMAPGLGRPPPLAQPRGIVLTDLGLGQLYQKIRDESGAAATTLRQLFQQGRLDSDVLGVLNAFVADVYAFNIVVTDRNSHNIVLETRRGRRRFVLVDGFGARTLIPMRRWSRRANARSLDVLFPSMGRKLGLAWDQPARRFRLAPGTTDGDAAASAPPAQTAGAAASEAWTVSLAGATRLASGAEKEIYERPGKPSQIVKVYRDDYARRVNASRRPKVVLRRLRAVGPHKNLLRQYRAYLDAALTAPALGRPPPLAQPRGLVLTDRGLGQLYQKIRDDTGGLAPTLGQIVWGGRMDDRTLAALNAFVADVYAFNIVMTDTNANNLVLETRKGRERFVLIDGFGVRTVIPFRRWSRRLNARALDRLFQRFGAKIGLAWDRGARRFTMASEP